MHVGHFGLKTYGTRNLEVSEAIDFGRTQQLLVQDIDTGAAFQSFVYIDDVLQLLQEPFVNLGQLVYLINGISLVHGLGNDEHALVGWLAQCLVDVLNLKFFVLHKAVHPLSNHAKSLLDSLFKVAADGHHFSNRLHGRAQFFVNTTEFGQVPTWNFAYHVVESRFEEGTGGLGDGVFQVEQAVTHS